MNLRFFCYLSIIEDKERSMRSKRDQWDQREINDIKERSMISKRDQWYQL